MLLRSKRSLAILRQHVPVLSGHVSTENLLTFSGPKHIGLFIVTSLLFGSHPFNQRQSSYEGLDNPSIRCRAKEDTSKSFAIRAKISSLAGRRRRIIRLTLATPGSPLSSRDASEIFKRFNAAFAATAGLAFGDSITDLKKILSIGIPALEAAERDVNTAEVMVESVGDELQEKERDLLQSEINLASAVTVSRFFVFSQGESGKLERSPPRTGLPALLINPSHHPSFLPPSTVCKTSAPSALV